MSDGGGFGALVARRVEERRSQIVLGLDPDPGRLWPQSAAAAGGGTGAQAAATAVAHHCRALIEAAGEACVAVKPQLACFERLGAAGRKALGETCRAAREAGLLVIADGKRGDIDVSAAAYAAALFSGFDTPFGRVDGLGADAATVNPYMGIDTLETFAEVAAGSGAGIFVLVRTSNPGAADFEDLPTGDGAVWERVAAAVSALGGDGPGLSAVGAVLGATEPEHLARARELMPSAIFLLPGVGAQGGSVEALAPAFAPGPAGGLVTASRSIANAGEASGSDPAQAAREEAERLRDLAWSLS
ncbi:MAG: orotidine-5'-phosphate decarboxylase [Solirubrobacterales bacterium]